MNPMTLLSLKGSLDKFQGNHPKFMQFISAMAQNGLAVDTILECKIITPEGKEIQANIKICEDDLELIEKIKEMKNS